MPDSGAKPPSTVRPRGAAGAAPEKALDTAPSLAERTLQINDDISGFALQDVITAEEERRALQLQRKILREMQRVDDDETMYEDEVMRAFGEQAELSWAAAFERATETIDPELTPHESAEVLKGLIQRNLLQYTDMRDNPTRFFEAHRILSKRLVGGFGIRFTVQYNLFAGSILGLGSDVQIAELDTLQDDAVLGCFALTEAGAGVNSGLVVGTTATWDPTSRSFVLHTPNELARKQWISQGLTASQMVVIADLIVKEKSHGPHAFLMPLRNAHGRLTPGVSVGDMGRKTIANDLDNAWISFDSVRIDRSCMLDRFATIEGADTYVSRGGETMRLEVIGQRLLTGRMCIAQAALVFARTLFKTTREYSDSKGVWNPADANATLSEVPQLAALYDRADRDLAEMEEFVGEIETRLCACLTESRIPSAELVEAIAVCKIRGVGLATELCFKLQQEVGSFALLGGGGFEHLDMLLCCKFAEGDERILMQKMARDHLKHVQKEIGGGPSGWFELATELMGEAPRRREAMKALQLALAMKTRAQRPSQKQSGDVAQFEADAETNQAARNQEAKAAMVAAWTDSWEEVYELAAAICDRHIAEVTQREQARLNAENYWVILAKRKEFAMQGRL
jgi:acyl-CoA oxidase